MAKPHSLPFGNQWREIELDLVRVRVLRESESLREAHHMGVHADGLPPESVAEHDIGCLSSHAGESEQIVQLVRNFAFEALDDFAAAVVNRLGFVAVEIDFVDFTFQGRHLCLGIVCRGSVFLEKIDGHAVNEIVPGLCRQNQGDEQLQGIGEIQVELGVRMSFFQALDDLLDPSFFPSGV